MSRSRFDLRAFLLGDAKIVNETSYDLKINVRLLDGGNQMFCIPVGASQDVLLEVDAQKSVLRAWRVGRPGFYDTTIKSGRAYALKF